MHYEDNQKISAVVFMQNYKIDNDILQELEDDTKDIKDILFSEYSLSQETLDTVAVILQKYVTILYETIEFEDLAFSLENLIKLFANIKVDELDEMKKERLMLYIQGLVDDLNNWKNHIFINMDTPDIHYLDASFLENIIEIEQFICSNEQMQKIDEEDLEFF